MNNGIIKKISGIILIILTAVLLSAAAFGSAPNGVALAGVAPSVVAPPETAQIADIYSPWAEDDVVMARDVYNLGDEGTYSNFRGDLYGVKFAPVIDSLNAALNSDIAFEPDDNPMMRAQVISVLYDIMSSDTDEAAAQSEAAAQGETAVQSEAVEYFIETGLLYGRSPDDYQLNNTCTVEEMIVLSARVYNHAIYEAGNYSTGFFWELEGAGNTVYLLGSIHLSDDSMYPMSKPIETAFARSGNLVVEADISNMSEAEIAFVAAKAFINPLSGETIADYLSEDTYALYTDVCDALEIPAGMYNYMRPWMAYDYLNMLLMSEGDAQIMEDNAASGIDMYFLLKGTASGKSILQLESFEFQIDMLASFSPELQEMLLLDVLHTAPGFGAEDESDGQPQPVDMAEFFRQALDAVKTGDEAAIIALFGIDAEVDNPLLMEYNQKMLTERDAAMAGKIAGFLEEEAYNGDYFIVVGAAHLLSKDSVIAKLSEMGYAAERIK